MSVVIVSGALANKVGNGGGAWERMSWVTGLCRLGFDVYFVEQIAPESCVDVAGKATTFADSVNLKWFRSVTQWFGIADRSALIDTAIEQSAGVPWQTLLEVAGAAELLVNLSGHLTFAPLFERIRRRAYVDVDPGFTQFWHIDPRTSFQVDGHDFYFTIGENIGTCECPIPAGGIDWRPIRQPVVLDDWPTTPEVNRCRFTTVASWRGPFGTVQCGGKTYGLKVHEFRKYLTLPHRFQAVVDNRPSFEIALDIHPGDGRDLAALHENGWRIVDPQVVAGDPGRFRRYVQESSAEFSVAQGIYVETNSGWFSDRTIRYLASGKPVLVQETGFSRQYPVGKGLVSFRTLDEAVAGAKSIAANYAEHSLAARAIAESYFDSDKVLINLMSAVTL